MIAGMVLTFLSSIATLGIGWFKDARDRRWKTEDKLFQQGIEVKTNVLIQKTEETKQQGTIIHDLVNSNMTAAMQDQLIALQGQLVLMQRVLLNDAKSGREETQEEKDTMTALKVKIAELTEAVRLRNVQQETAKVQAKADRDAITLAASAPPPVLIPPLTLKSLQ